MFKNILPLPTDADGVVTLANPYAPPSGSSSVVVTEDPAAGIRSFRVDMEKEKALLRKQFWIQASIFCGSLAVMLSFLFVTMASELRGGLLAIPAVVIGCIAGYLWFLASRFRKMLVLARTFVLDVGEGFVRRRGMDKPTITLHRPEVRALSQLAAGAFVLVGPTPETSILVPTNLVGRAEVLEHVQSWAAVAPFLSKVDRVLNLLLPLAFLVLLSTRSGSASLLRTSAALVVVGLSCRAVVKTWQSRLLTRRQKVVFTIGFVWLFTNGTAPLVQLAMAPHAQRSIAE